MCQAINDLKAFCDDREIKINLSSIPELGIAPIEFVNPFEKDEEEVMVANNMHVTVSKQPDGSIHALNKVSDQYKLVQHHEVLRESIEAILTEAPEFGKPIFNLQFTNNGGRMFAEATFPEAIEIQKGDPVKPQAVFTNSADLSKRYTLHFGAFRTLCSNGLVIPDGRFPDYVQIKSLHKQGTMDLHKSIRQMIAGFENFSETIGIWKDYAELQITQQGMTDILEDLGLSEKQAEGVLSAPLRGFDTPLITQFASNQEVDGWKAYNSITQHITDNVKNPGTALDRGRKASDIFDGLLVQA